MSWNFKDAHSNQSISCKSFPGFYDGKENAAIIVDETIIRGEDFADIVMYYMTNMDLFENDIRIQLKDRITNLVIAEGFNLRGSHRFIELPKVD